VFVVVVAVISDACCRVHTRIQMRNTFTLPRKKMCSGDWTTGGTEAPREGRDTSMGRLIMFGEGEMDAKIDPY
jgi:hypothetical protein